MKKTFFKAVALMLTLCMLLCTFAACGDSDATSTPDDDILYGNAVDEDTEDDAIPDDDLLAGDSDEDSDGSKVTTSSKGDSNKGNNTSSGSKKDNGKTSTPSYSSNVGQVSSTYEVDENAKEAFFKSVPKSLKGKTVRVLIWWDPGVTESKKAEVFEKKTGIKIKFIKCGSGNAYYTKLSALIGQGNAPDLACITQDNFPNAVIQNYFDPITVGKLDLNDSIYDKDTMNYFKCNDKYYGAMVKSSTMITFYCCFFNKDLYKGIDNPYDLWQKNQWNWDTLVSSTQKVMNANKQVKYGIVGDYSCHYFAQTTGADLVEFKDGTIVNNTKNADILKGYQKLSDLKNKDKILSTGTNYTYFVSGQSPIMFTGNYIMQTGDVLDKNVKFDWGVAPLPCPAGQKTVVPSNVKLWGFARGAKNTEAASYWLRYWLDESMDEEGYNLWTNEESRVFNNWLWEQKKQFVNWTGIVTFGGNYVSDNVISELIGEDSSNTKTAIEKWSGVIDANIKTIMSRK